MPQYPYNVQQEPWLNNIRPDHQLIIKNNECVGYHAHDPNIIYDCNRYPYSTQNDYFYHPQQQDQLEPVNYTDYYYNQDQKGYNNYYNKQPNQNSSAGNYDYYNNYNSDYESYYNNNSPAYDTYQQSSQYDYSTKDYSTQDYPKQDYDQYYYGEKSPQNYYPANTQLAQVSYSANDRDYYQGNQIIPHAENYYPQPIGRGLKNNASKFEFTGYAQV